MCVCVLIRIMMDPPLQGTAKVVSFCIVFKKSAAEQCLAEVVSFWGLAS